ncbi:MAG: N-formylglutamate deformylase, partial [Woeseiaceae bacterium]|nr:N-formylglutamate deformylase [Woeseiaceae bacterium]
MSIPHVGQYIPDDIVGNLMPVGTNVGDTDWYLDRLYDFADELGASVLKANYSRYVIDLNRAPDGEPLYPGSNNTELVPTSTFKEEPLYKSGRNPSSDE